jgi:hypothetical protein
MERPELSITRQTLEANETLSRGLQSLDKFTKIEILQIVDLSPRTDVELYVVSASFPAFLLLSFSTFKCSNRRLGSSLTVHIRLCALRRSSKSSTPV